MNIKNTYISLQIVSIQINKLEFSDSLGAVLRSKFCSIHARLQNLEHQTEFPTYLISLKCFGTTKSNLFPLYKYPLLHRQT